MLGAIKERNLALEGYCQTEGCGRFNVFDVDGLISGLGADYMVPTSTVSSRYAAAKTMAAFAQVFSCSAFRVSAIRLRSHGAETAHTRTCFC